MVNIEYSLNQGEFSSVCLKCKRIVRGTEQKYKSLHSGNRKFPVVICFSCVCGQKWYKGKQAIIRAIDQGFCNIYGIWIKCDERGQAIEESILEAIRKTGASREQACRPLKSV